VRVNRLDSQTAQWRWLLPVFDVPRSQFHPDQMAQLRLWCEKYKPKHIVEVGSWLGKSTSVFGQYAKETGGLVLAVDWWQSNPDVGLCADGVYEQFRANMKELGIDDVVIPIRLRSDVASKLIKDLSIDMVFIDGDHKYESVRQDISLWMGRVKHGGVMCGHDFESLEYDEKYINQDVNDHKHHGVIKAVVETFNNVRYAERMWLAEI
jgi:predicted O-methyltransferase YrrM